jgi:hypothetical protein
MDKTREAKLQETKPQKPYLQMLRDLAQQISIGRAMLQRMGLYRAYASLRDYLNPLRDSEPQHIQSRARTSAEANGLSVAFWLTKSATKSATETVDPRVVVSDTANLVEEVINLAPQPRPYACRRGCHFCCYEAVTVSEVEAAALARHVHELPQGEKNTLIARLEQYAAVVTEVGEVLMPKNRMPCAFLDTESGACTVYSIRPFMCRGLTSYDVAPCQTPDQHYQVDYIRYNAYVAAFVGASHSDLPDHMTVMKLPPAQQATGENLAVGVLRQLSTLQQESQS